MNEREREGERGREKERERKTERETIGRGVAAAESRREKQQPVAQAIGSEWGVAADVNHQVCRGGGIAPTDAPAHPEARPQT